MDLFTTRILNLFKMVKDKGLEKELEQAGLPSAGNQPFILPGQEIRDMGFPCCAAFQIEGILVGSVGIEFTTRYLRLMLQPMALMLLKIPGVHR